MDNHNPLKKRLVLVGVCAATALGAFILVIAELAVWRIEPHERERVRTNAYHRLEYVQDRVLHTIEPPPRHTTDAILEASDELHPFLQRVEQESDSYSYVMVVSPDGFVLAHSKASKSRRGLPAEVFSQLTLADRAEPREVGLDSWFGPGRIIDFAMPVILDRQVLASVHLGVSEPELTKHIADQQAFVHRWFKLTVAMSAAVLVVAGAIAWRLIRGSRQADAEAQRQTHLAEVGKLADGLAHEIRNPLNAMRMQVAVIRNQLKKINEPSLETAKTQLDRLESEVLRLQDLATDFLTFGRHDVGHPKHVTLAQLLRDVADFIQPTLEQRRIQLVLEIEPGAERAGVVMDRDKLRQVLLNVATNAEQAMPEGGTLTVSLAEPSRQQLHLTMRDTGCGISHDKLDRVFEAFFSTKDEGSGLGLPISKKLIETAGGSIDITSQVGRGTTVEINLPVAEPREADEIEVRQPGDVHEVNP